MKAADLPEISPAQQKALFLITYAEIEEHAKKSAQARKSSSNTAPSNGTN